MSFCGIDPVDPNLTRTLEPRLLSAARDRAAKPHPCMTLGAPPPLHGPPSAAGGTRPALKFPASSPGGALAPSQSRWWLVFPQQLPTALVPSCPSLRAPCPLSE